MSTVARTTPYPWPWDGRLDPARLALVAVSPRTSGEDVPDRELWQVVRATAMRVRAAGGVVVQVTTTPPDRSAGHRDLRADVGADVVVDAAGVDGFYGSSLDDLLRRGSRDQLLLSGAWLETSVHSTMRSANDRGYECLLVLDACQPFDASLARAARSQIEMSGGIFGAVGFRAELHDALRSA
ncbi:cysteine hydrolase family protein [Nocardioides stalactiti]|uniref:cysteine hydrolase family protein n=1 Tax=Nocardioides stalactiti TaxID=2755356 RepID=UPI001603F96B|nr:isochorismatase family protein [Nocardioides stalactiti]